MSDSYKPGPWLSPTPAQRPVSVSTNVVLPPDASQSDTNVLMSVAGEIVDGHRTQLDRFVNNNRQQQSLNQSGYMDKFVALDGMTARHRFNNGYESVDLNVSPTGIGGFPSGTTDTNLDGYLLWVHAEPGYPDTINGQPSTCGPFAIVMNGYKIEGNYNPPLGPGNTGGYVFVFGKTALLCSSLAQDLDRANPLIDDKLFKQPLKVIPAPGWGNDVGNTLDGVELKREPRELGYWVFDWLNPYNPAQYINLYPILSLSPQYVKWQDFLNGPNSSLGNLTLNRGIYFPSAAKSILNPTGANGMQVFSLSPRTPAGIVVDLWYGEFFDRGKYRIVRQSWTRKPERGTAIKVNDFPNRYLFQQVQNPEGNYHGYTADFDLSAKFSRDATDNLNNGPTNNVMSTLGSAGVDVSVTPAQQATLDAWRAANVKIYQDFAAAEAPILVMLLKAVTDLAGPVAEAHKLAFLMRAYTGDYTLYNNYFDDSIWYTPPGATQPLTHGTPRAPLAQPFVTFASIMTTYAEDPDHPGHFIQTGQTVSQSGRNQEYYIDVTDSQDLSVYQDNAATGLTSTGIDQRFVQIGTASDVTTGSPASGSTTETITYAYDDNGVPVGGLHDKVIGPSEDLTGLEILAAAFIINTMDTYNAALLAYNTELAKTPPGLLPFPNIGDDLSKFAYDYITISDGKWSYKQ